MKNYEMIKFVDNDFELDVSVSPSEKTIWLSQDQIALLFGKSRSTITEHINNIFSEGELEEMTSVGNSDRSNHRPAKLYNLDVVLAVGYRVKSERGIIFRRWANSTLKEYLLKGYVMSSDRALVTDDNYISLVHEVNGLKQDVDEMKKILYSKLDDSLICYEGAYYDGFSFINKLICSAKNRVFLIDGYADNKVLDFFVGCKKSVEKTIICQKAERMIPEVAERFEKQYGRLLIKQNRSFHDRFVIVDNEVFTVGTSLNSIGNKTSVIAKAKEIEPEEILKAIS